jgi:hypothetical protein
MRCISTAWSRSRCVCSTYRRVFLGTASGMSCSAGGPAGTSEASKFAVRFSILKVSDPLRVANTSVLPSRPYGPKRMAVTVSGIISVATNALPL